MSWVAKCLSTRASRGSAEDRAGPRGGPAALGAHRLALARSPPSPCTRSLVPGPGPLAPSRAQPRSSRPTQLCVPLSAPSLYPTCVSRLPPASDPLCALARSPAKMGTLGTASGTGKVTGNGQAQTEGRDQGRPLMTLPQHLGRVADAGGCGHTH